MYIQTFVKGISGDVATGIDWARAQDMVSGGHGILSNWWREKNSISPPEVDRILNHGNLDRHLHDYDIYGPKSPFISLACGCVDRNALLSINEIYSAVDTALSFATSDFLHEGYLYYGWVIVGLNPAIQLRTISESVRDLNVYHGWSPFQLEGEVTAKVHIPSNQIERVERWEGYGFNPVEVYRNPGYEAPSAIVSLREFF